MKKYSLTAEIRDIFGRKVKQLRTLGRIPATVYGKNVKSVSVVVSAEAFDKVYTEAGETGLVELSVGRDIRPVLVHTLQKDPVSNHLLHIEFHQVDLKEKVHAKVPLELTGDAPAVVGKIGVLLTLIDEVEVEALPTDLPEKITVDVSKLAEVNREVKVSELKIPAGVTVLTDKDQSVVRVGALISKEAEAEAAAEAAEAAAAAAEAAAATPPAGGAPAEGVPTAEKPAEAAKPQEPAGITPKTSK
ncbi:MAG: 50S ribosomal protein L25 [Candidatus Gottesmanbacteria bacterium]|nr:50S ribosomal protein L25 [Candidatus Gottesmanbacteria bacterium]